MRETRRQAVVITIVCPLLLDSSPVREDIGIDLFNRSSRQIRRERSGALKRFNHITRW